MGVTMSQTLEFVIAVEDLNAVRLRFECYRTGIVEVTSIDGNPTKKMLTIDTRDVTGLQVLAKEHGLHARVVG